MPIYGYRCESCGHQLEVLQRMSDAPLETCPKCQGKLVKMLYPTGVIFKGSGYYTTDYKGSSQSPAASNGSSPAGSETKSESSSESKSESKGSSEKEKSA